MKSKILSATIALPLAFAFVSCDKPEAIETAAADHLAPAEWTTSIAAALTSEILPQLEHLITEVRLILNAADQHPDLDDEDLP